MVPNVYLPDTVPIRVQLNLAFPNGLPLAPGHNSAVALKRPGIDRGAQKRTYLTPLHMARWLAAADESPDALLMGLLLGECGLRIGEATGLDIEDLGEHRGHDTMTVLGKGNKTAVIPIPVPVMRVLRDTIGDRTTGPVLLNKRGRRMTRSNAGYLIRKVALAAGVSTDISPHTFRRVMITTALQMGIPVHKVQLAARHSSINTTMIYNRYDGFDDHATHTVAGFYSQFA
jgi:site-specific recombinase XerD